MSGLASRLAAAAAALAAGCAVSPPVVRTYHFEEIPLAETGRRSPASLSVGPFAAASHLHGASLAARVSPVEIETYAGHRWAAPLEEFVPLAIARGLRATGAFREVRLGEEEADFRLEGTILAFEEVDRAEGWWGVVELDLRLLRGEERLWGGTIRSEQPAADRHPERVVDAIRAALAEVVGRALAEILAAAEASPSSPSEPGK